MKYLNTLQDRVNKNVSLEGHTHTKNEISDFPIQTISNGNFNNMIEPGIYIMRASSTNSPSGSYNSLLVMKSDTGNYVQQLAINESSGKVYTRRLQGSTWSAWEELAKVNQVPTKLSDLTNDMGFTKNALIQTVSNTAPIGPVLGQVWIQTY